MPDTLFVRDYPEHELAAQLLGNVGQVSPGQLKESRFRGVHQGTIVGKGGVELVLPPVDEPYPVMAGAESELPFAVQGVAPRESSGERQ